jgi:autotransporter-associated beta strand protein
MLNRTKSTLRAATVIACVPLLWGVQANAQAPAGYNATPAFSDEFNDTSIDTSKWNGGVINYASGNTWLRRNHPGNNTESGGYLFQTTIYQDVTGDGLGDWTCSHLVGKYAQRFGYWEVRMKINKYAYTDSNFWSSEPSGTHMSGLDGFEIDAPEAWGSWRNNTQRTSSRYTSNVYDHNSSLQNPFEQAVASPDLSDTFNTYAWEWSTDNSVKVYMNGALLFTHSAEFMNSIEALVPQAPILGTALWTTGYNNGPTGNSVADGDSKLVDYVRVYQKPGWTGSNAVKAWNNPANWGPDGMPGSGRAAVFNTAASNGTITLGVDQPVQEITFQTATTGVTSIDGPGNLLLGATSATNAQNVAIGGINLVTDVTKSVTVNADIVAQRKLQFSNHSGVTYTGGTAGVTLALNGTLSAATPGTELVFLTAGPIRVNGTIDSKIGDIAKGGQGVVSLNVANSFTGAIDHRAGVIEVNADGALGATTEGVNLSQTNPYGSPSLVFGNVNYTTPEPVSIRGTGNAANGFTARQGAIDVTGTGTVASFAGPITLADDATIGFGSAAMGATLTLTGAIDVVDHVLTLNGGGTLNLGGQIKGVNVNGTGQIIKTGTGTAVLSGLNTAFKGSVVFRAGTVSISSINALGGGTGDILQFDGGTLMLTAVVSTSKGGSFTANGGTINTNGQAMTSSGVFAGPGGFNKMGLGTLTLNGANSYTGTTSVSAGTLVFGASQTNDAPLSIGASGTVVLASNGSRVLLVPTLAILPGGKLDLTNNALVLDYDVVAPITAIRSMLRDGRLVGSGAVSSYRLGYGEQSALNLTSYAGATLDSSSLLVRYALAGDCNLDNVVNFDDLLILASRYNTPSNAVWTQGDFTYDGAVNFDDLLLLAASYNQSFAADFALARAIVPEPRAFGVLLMLSSIAVLRQR